MTQKKNNDLRKFDGRQDELDPRYLFNGTHTQLLIEALNGEYDIKYLVRLELANRGLDKEGRWIGFDKAKKLHKVENE